MFQPGHVEISQLPVGHERGYQLALDYRVERSEAGEPSACFHLYGHVGEIAIDDEFRLDRDVFYNFLQRVGQCLRAHGVHTHPRAVFSQHAVYDPLFEDIRHQLGAHPGDPVDLSHLD